MNAIDLSSYSIGFLGCGKISSAVCRGFASLNIESKPQRLIVSKRNEMKSSNLFNEYPDIVQVYESNDLLVKDCQVIFIGLLPKTAKQILPTLPFNDKQLVISMMAAVDYEVLLQLLPNCNANSIVKIVPLPSASRRTGPILMYPKHDIAESMLRMVGTPVICQTESEMKPMITITGHISSFYELLRMTQDWIVKNGVDEATAKNFTSSFYSSLSSGAEQSHESFAALCDEAATPGGLNEQSLNFLRNSMHYTLAEESLQQILNRLLNK